MVAGEKRGMAVSEPAPGVSDHGIDGAEAAVRMSATSISG